MHFIWRDEHVPLFLKVYKKHECLWNNKTSSYNNAGTRERAYISLIRELNFPGLTVAHVKAKIKTIRTRYSTELAKILRSEESGECGEVYEPRLFWFREADSFLRAVCIPKRSYWNGQTFGIPNEINMCRDNSFDLDIKVKYEMPAVDPLKIANECDNSTESRGGVRKRKTEAQVESTHQPEKATKAKMESCGDLDEFDLFCNSLAVQLKKMPLHRALVCQEKLQTVMTHERLAYIMESEKCAGLVMPVECVVEDENSVSSGQECLSGILDENSILSPS